MANVQQLLDQINSAQPADQKWTIVGNATPQEEIVQKTGFLLTLPQVRLHRRPSTRALVAISSPSRTLQVTSAR